MNPITQQIQTKQPHFGWNNSDNLPKDYHFVVDESNIGDYFEGVKSKLEAKEASELRPTASIIEKAVESFKSTDEARLFILDIPDSLKLNPEILEKYQYNLFKKIIEQVKTLNPWQNASLKTYQDINNKYFRENDFLTGIGLAKTLNRLSRYLRSNAQPNHRKTSLHWDVSNSGSPIVKGVPFLAILHGKRENIEETSALSLFSDFNQWYKDQHFEKPIETLSEDEVAMLLLDNSQEIEDHYTLTIPSNKGFKRFSLLSNSPQYGGLFHGVTLPIETSEDANREVKQGFAPDSNLLPF